MRADNSHLVIAAARRRAAATRHRAVAALRRMDNAGPPITFDAVAREAHVSRSWLYNQPDLRAEIERLRARRQPAPHRAAAFPTGNAPPTPRCYGASRSRPSESPAGSREPTAPRGARPRPRRTARDHDPRPAPATRRQRNPTSHRTLLRPTSTTLATKHQRRSTQQATTELKITSGMCASGPSMRSANTVSMMAWSRWVMSASATGSVESVKNG